MGPPPLSTTRMVASCQSRSRGDAQIVAAIGMTESVKTVLIPKWKPRAGRTGYAAWNEALGDASISLGFGLVLNSPGEPTAQEIVERFINTGMTVQQMLAVLDAARS